MATRKYYPVWRKLSATKLLARSSFLSFFFFFGPAWDNLIAQAVIKVTIEAVEQLDPGTHI